MCLRTSEVYQNIQLPKFSPLTQLHPGNLVALRYFKNHRKDLPTILYILITVVDIFSCSTCLPTAVSYIYDRQPMWYGNTVFCYGWGMLWAIIPFVSVFLVAVLSITRTISLVNPLRQIKMKKVMIFVTGYCLYLLLWSTVPIAFKYGKFVYTPADTYCWESTKEGWYSNLEIVNGAVLLAFPIIPVIISCIISTYCVLSSLRISSLSNAVRNMKLEATITIILITVTYIVLNLPIFIIWVLYIYDNFTVREDTFLQYYSWSLCYVICVSINATLNPFIYISRMEKFRGAVKSCFNRGKNFKRESYRSNGSRGSIMLSRLNAPKSFVKVGDINSTSVIDVDGDSRKNSSFV